MKLTIRSVFTSLLVTFAFALPLNQAHATIIGGSYGHTGIYSGSDFKIDFNSKFGFDGDKDQYISKLLQPKDSQRDGFGDYERSFCYCDDGKCDNGDHNVPEPTPLVLLALGLGAIGLVRRFALIRRRKN
jgi:hypothetical protein